MKNRDGNLLMAREMRDAPIPEHACMLVRNEDGYCTVCGERRTVWLFDGPRRMR